MVRQADIMRYPPLPVHEPSVQLTSWKVPAFHSDVEWPVQPPVMQNKQHFKQN